MSIFTHLRISPIQLRLWLMTVLFILSGALAATAANGDAIYSNDNRYYTADTYRPKYNFLNILTAEAGIQHPERAADANLTNFATIHNDIEVVSTMKLQLSLNANTAGGQAGDRAGVLVGNFPTDLNLVNLFGVSAITLRTYKAGTLKQTVPVSAAVIRALLLDVDRPTQLEFVAEQAFDRIDIEVSGIAAVSYKLKIYYAYAVPSLVQQPALGLISQFAGQSAADLAPYYGAGTGGVGIVSVCGFNGIEDPEHAVDKDLSNYATFNNLATVSCPSALTVALEGSQPAPAGYYAGFVIGSGSDGLLDASVLSGLRVTTYLNGVKQESQTGIGVLELRLLPDGKTQVSFPSTLAFDEVKIERVGLLTVLDDLEIYYGFGVEPKAFEAETEVLSDFDSDEAEEHATVTQSGGVLGLGVCLGCSVSNPEGAADNDPATNAVINVGVGVANVVELKLDLNADGTNTGEAGNRAGVVLDAGINLLDLSVLERITITTYSGNQVLESASGSSLLSVTLLPDGRQELSFLTTQDFSAVSITVGGLATVLQNITVAYAFADDRAGGLPMIVGPLPVELTAFTGRWANGGTDLNWATASEKNSSHFVVERSTGRDAAFQAIGQVQSAGNSSRNQTYKLRDTEAGAQGVAMLYYRLRQVDVDGQQAYSPVVSVAMGKLRAAAPQLSVYPNPATDAKAVMVQCTDLPATGGTVQTYSQLGQLVSQQPVTEAAARLALPALAPGLYHVVLLDAAGQRVATQRLVVGAR
ncbi:T9SS type A sorting domain-containing protein [Hymenobacter sp. BT683]|uniref:T9SS type A sorting domain-containing protein n=1 Tax=Hymenobacter jeongseonensis TaxID=2791027 RepID=A0ABS0IJR7_9BACT|nr:T9SS type A sorting domain-containing protein [Hymenobacter jeongseonensis]MBF9238612.1 T9SS type A sorting domain-containing protein [Hymenobacter jeongseonensis]